MTSPGGQWGDLGQRLVSGGIAACLGLGLMWWGGLAFHILVAVVAGIMVWEVTRMIGAGRHAIPYGILGGLTLLLLSGLPLTYTLPLLFAPGLLGVAQLKEHRVTYAVFVTVLLIAALGIITLRDNFGFLWVAWLALVVVASDVLGYFGGKLIGGPKFWPKVSPKKTWSGTIAGWFGAVVISLIYIALGHAGAEIIGVSIAVAIAGQLGDVAESALKRHFGVKDSSNILPGHGGMFDRFDAMLGASLFVLLVAQMTGFPPVTP